MNHDRRVADLGKRFILGGNWVFLNCLASGSSVYYVLVIPVTLFVHITANEGIPPALKKIYFG